MNVLREVLSQTEPATGIEAVELSPREFRELGVPGSPTILLNDRDLFPPAKSCPPPPAAGSTPRREA